MGVSIINRARGVETWWIPETVEPFDEQ
jgi:hypothetical protein